MRKKTVITGLVGLMLGGIVLAGAIEPSPEVTLDTGVKKIDVNGKELVTLFTDDNKNETLIVRSDREIYGGWDSIDVYFSIENTSVDQNVTIEFQSDGRSQMATLERLEKNVPYQKEVIDEKQEVKIVDYTVDEWKIVPLANKRGQYYIPTGQTYFFHAKLSVPKQRTSGTFSIVVTGDSGGFGKLE